MRKIQIVHDDIGINLNTPQEDIHALTLKINKVLVNVC